MFGLSIAWSPTIGVTSRITATRRDPIRDLIRARRVLAQSERVQELVDQQNLGSGRVLFGVRFEELFADEDHSTMRRRECEALAAEALGRHIALRQVEQIQVLLRRPTRFPKCRGERASALVNEVRQHLLAFGRGQSCAGAAEDG